MNIFNNSDDFLEEYDDYVEYDEDDSELDDSESDDFGAETDDQQDEFWPSHQCGVAVYFDALQCPECGAYVEEYESSTWSSRPLWWILLGLLGVAALILSLVLPML